MAYTIKGNFTGLQPSKDKIYNWSCFHWLELTSLTEHRPNLVVGALMKMAAQAIKSLVYYKTIFPQMETHEEFFLKKIDHSFPRLSKAQAGSFPPAATLEGPFKTGAVRNST